MAANFASPSGFARKTAFTSSMAPALHSNLNKPIIGLNTSSSRLEGACVSTSLQLSARGNFFTEYAPLANWSCNHKCLTSKCFMRPTPRLCTNCLATVASVYSTMGTRPKPTSSKLNCNNRQSFSTSDIEMISDSPLLKACSAVPRECECIRHPDTITTAPETLLRSMSSQAQSPST